MLALLFGSRKNRVWGLGSKVGKESVTTDLTEEKILSLTTPQLLLYVSTAVTHWLNI